MQHQNYLVQSTMSYNDSHSHFVISVHFNYFTPSCSSNALFVVLGRGGGFTRWLNEFLEGWEV